MLCQYGFNLLTENVANSFYANIFSNSISDVTANITTVFIANIFAFPPLRFKIFKYFTSHQYVKTKSLAKLSTNFTSNILQHFTGKISFTQHSQKHFLSLNFAQWFCWRELYICWTTDCKPTFHKQLLCVLHLSIPFSPDVQFAVYSFPIFTRVSDGDAKSTDFFGRSLPDTRLKVDVESGPTKINFSCIFANIKFSPSKFLVPDSKGNYI